MYIGIHMRICICVYTLPYTLLSLSLFILSTLFHSVVPFEEGKEQDNDS